jgi:hypothetical protein
MLLADVQQRLMLDRLRRAGGRPVALTELRASGIDFPATVVSELELYGYTIERVYENRRLVGIRLSEPESSEASSAHRHRWRPWAQS